MSSSPFPRDSRISFRSFVPTRSLCCPELILLARRNYASRIRLRRDDSSGCANNVANLTNSKLEVGRAKLMRRVRAEARARENMREKLCSCMAAVTTVLCVCVCMRARVGVARAKLRYIERESERLCVSGCDAPPARPFLFLAVLS